MKKAYYFLLLLLLPLLSRAQEGGAEAYYPSSPKISTTVSTFDLPARDQSVRLAAVSLQGLVNRTKPSIYLNESATRWSMDYYLRRKDVRRVRHYDDIYQLIADNVAALKGVVVYDPDKPYTINLATNVAGVEERIIAAPSMIPALRKIGLNDIHDLRDHNFASAADAFAWYMKEYFPRQNHSVLACCYYSQYHDAGRDYLIEFRLPVFWLPGKQDDDYDPTLEAQIIKLFEQTPPNIPVTGFWPMGPRGYREYDGVMLGGYYGKFTAASSHAGNYSFHSGVKVSDSVFAKQKANSAPLRTYSPDKKYVALIMIESGDAPGYFQYLFMPWQWEDRARGKVPISWAVTPALRYLAPGILRRIYTEATVNDYLFCSISGSGYCYPLIGYGSRTADPETCVSDYMQMTVDHMKMLDMQMLGLYTHPRTWNEQDDEIVRRLVAPHPEIRSVISDMSRIDPIYNTRPNYFVNDATTIHHTATVWLIDDSIKDPRGAANDKILEDYLVKEIRDHIGDNRFVQAMFLSWHYSPSRLLQVVRTLEKEGYEFVTLRDLDNLYRVSQQKN